MADTHGLRLANLAPSISFIVRPPVSIYALLVHMFSPETLSKVLEAVAKDAWAVFVMAAFVLFVPDDAAKQLGIDGIKAEYKGYFWLTLVFTGALMLGAVFSYINKKVLDEWLGEKRSENRRSAKKAEQLNAIALRLNSLNDRELLWVKYCLFHNVQTLSAKMDDVTAQSLLNKGILSQGSGSMLNLPFHIPDEVWAYLQESHFLFLSEEEATDPRFEKYLESFRKSLYPSHWMA